MAGKLFTFFHSFAAGLFLSRVGVFLWMFSCFRFCSRGKEHTPEVCQVRLRYEMPFFPHSIPHISRVFCIPASGRCDEPVAIYSAKGRICKASDRRVVFTVRRSAALFALGKIWNRMS